MDAEIVKSMFTAADTRDPNELGGFFNDDIRLRLGSIPFVEGVGPVEETLTSFYSYVAQMRHGIVAVHQAADVWAVEAIAYDLDEHGG